MQQLYLIRDLLESEILVPPSCAAAGDNRPVARDQRTDPAADNDLDAVIQLNREFHDLVTESSPLTC